MVNTAAQAGEPSDSDAPEHVEIIYRRLEKLPVHLVEHVGSIALRLSHRDMHPTKDVEYTTGVFKQTDYSAKITDPGFETAHLEADAVEAAHAGKKELEDLMHDGSSLLQQAHELLVLRGHNFEPPEGENEDVLKSREKAERDLLYSTAVELATTSAVEHKKADRAGQAIKSIEALNLVAYIHGKNDQYPQNRHQASSAYRDLVHEGLAEELLTAGQRSEKIAEGEEYGTQLSGHMLMSRDLLQMATGKSIGYSLEVDGDFGPEKVDRIVGADGIADVIAVVTAASDMPEETRRRYLDSLKNYMFYDDLERYVGRFSDLRDAQTLYEIARDNTLNDKMDMSSYLKFDDPESAYGVGKRLKIPAWQLETLFGRNTDEGTGVKIFNKEDAEWTINLADKYPDYFQTVIDTLLRGYVADTPKIREVLEGMEHLEQIGLLNPSIVELLAFRSGNDIIEGCDKLSEYLRQTGRSLDQLDEEISIEYAMALKGLVVRLGNNGAEAAKTVENYRAEAEIIRGYMKKYKSNSHISNWRDAARIRCNLAEMPIIGQRLTSLGLSAELTSAIFDSWNTYSGWARRLYDNEERGIHGPIAIDDFRNNNGVVDDQKGALMAQVEAIETFAETYGKEKLAQIIDTFGIYNFSRHKSSALFNQLVRWQKDKSAVSVVVDARADWNSFAGKSLSFENPDEEASTYFFEANSGTEVGKIAVRIGEHERAAGREPDVRRFVLHAHGNPTGILMGVNDERINTASYLESAEKRRGLPKAELNDYKRHLGPNFIVILQSCSTADEALGKNFALTLSEAHGVEVRGSTTYIHGLSIEADGTVRFRTSEGDGASVVYSPSEAARL